MDASTKLLLSPPSTSLLSLERNGFIVTCKRSRFQTPLKVLDMAKESRESDNGVTEKAALVGGPLAIPVIAWSLYKLKKTGCGLLPGPGGSMGALERVSYLVVVVGIVGWSLYTKAKTDSRLPNGPLGLLGAV